MNTHGYMIVHYRQLQLSFDLKWCQVIKLDVIYRIYYTFELTYTDSCKNGLHA